MNFRTPAFAGAREYFILENVMSFWLVFIPLFVAIDPIGTLPLFLAMTHGHSRPEKRRLAVQAVVTAFAVGLTFGVAGRFVFSILGITDADFKVAGGLLLLILSVKEIFGATAKNVDAATPDALVGVVPLGIPLIAGPAMITTLLILHESFSFLVIMAALVANLAIALVLFVYSDRIVRLVGEATAKASAKIIAIFLAAIGVMMIREGLESILN